MKRFAKVAAAGIGALGLLMSQAPAQATNGAVAFVGAAEVNPGLGYPVISTGGGGTWSFDFVLGVGVTDTPNAGTVTGGAHGALRSGTLQNTLGAPFNGGAFCGMSGGYDNDPTNVNGPSGSITLDGVSGSESMTLDNVGWDQSLATLIVFNGDASGGSITGLVTALPTTGSCASGTATGFTIVGASVVTD